MSLCERPFLLPPSPASETSVLPMTSGTGGDGRGVTDPPPARPSSRHLQAGNVSETLLSNLLEICQCLSIINNI